MTAPEISVLLPAFDAELTLAAALASVQRQTETRWECLVVDDGSRDGTREIALAVARSDARVRVLSRPHGGIVSALQAGLAECRAPLVARMDADDLMSRRRLELQRTALEQAPELTAVGCHVRLFPRRHLRARRIDYERWLGSIRTPDDVQREAFVECPIAHPTLVIRKRALDEFGYRDAAWPEDYDLLLRLLHAGHRIGVVPRRLLHWRDGPSRLSRTSDRYAISAFVQCKAEFLARGFLARGERYLLWGFGDTGRRLRKRSLSVANSRQPSSSCTPGASVSSFAACAWSRRVHCPRCLACRSSSPWPGSRLARKFAWPSRAWAIASSRTTCARPEGRCGAQTAEIAWNFRLWAVSVPA